MTKALLNFYRRTDVRRTAETIAGILFVRAAHDLSLRYPSYEGEIIAISGALAGLFHLAHPATVRRRRKEPTP